MNLMRYYIDKLGKLKCPMCGAQGPSARHMQFAEYEISRNDDTEVTRVGSIYDYIRLTCDRCGYEFYIEAKDYSFKQGEDN